MNSVGRMMEDVWRLLTFREPSAAIVESWRGYLAVGLGFTWLAGVGRYWDSPRALQWQQWGLGSLAYVFLLALVIWLIVIPLRPERWSYRSVLVFVTLTSPPALLYAIPVERFMTLGDAQTMNAWFLAGVAAWRVALLVWFVWSVARISGMALVVATGLPLALIVVTLTMLNLEHVVFRLMAGMGPDERSANDGAYFVVMVLGFLSTFAAPTLLAVYLWLCLQAWRGRRRGAE
jgi:hypothetical protein